MQQKLLQKLIFALLAWVAIPAAAYDFEVDGIYYNVVSTTDLTCEVTSGDKKYEGDVVIPSTVTYKNKTLSVTEVGESAFFQCKNLTDIQIPNSIVIIGEKAFLNCVKLTKVILPNSVAKIEDCAFDGCTGITDITIPSSVTRINISTFYGCSSLASVVIPNSVTSIEYWAFNGCTSLTSIVIPGSVTKLGEKAFANCGLESVTALGTTPATIRDDAFMGSYVNATLYVPKESLTDYQEASGWNNFWNIEAVSEGTTGIEAAETASEEYPAAIYDLQGRRLDDPQKGVNIIRQTDGKTHTIIRK